MELSIKCFVFIFAGEYYSKLKFNDNATKSYNYDNSRLAFFFAYLFCIFTYFARLDSKNFAIEEGAVFILATIIYVIIGALFILFVTLKSCYKAYQLCHNNGKYFKDICDKTNNIREMYLPLAILYFVLVSSFGLLAKPIDGFTICASVLLGFSILVLKFGAISNPKLRFYKENSFILHTIGSLLIIVSA